VLITGAGSGLGRQLALDLASRGAKIAAVDLNADGVASLVAEIGGAGAVGDVSDCAALAEAVAGLERQLGPVEILVANAGIAREMSALDFQPEDLEAQVRINLVGVANSIAAVLPGMLRRRQGQLVAISSLASYRGALHGAGYCASKAGVNALMDSLRLELRPHGIVCTTICPGWIRTPLAHGIHMRKPGTMSVERAARRIVKAIDRRRSFDAFPLVSRVVMALVSWLPAYLVDGAIRRFLSRKQRQNKGSAIQPPFQQRRVA
jgi:NAD(P)-dependent dehydrogenase (short-subunit alcohol dehydrogenase family)